MSVQETRGIVLLVSGPAGIGKTTVCENLLSAFGPKLQRAVTVTTRAPRVGEVNGVDYHFLSADVFEKKAAAGKFYEHAIVHGNHYGTLKSEVRERLNAGIDLLLNVDVQGAEAFRRAAETDEFLLGKLHTVFIMPADLVELRHRLAQRGTDTKEEIERRMQTAQSEMARRDEFDHCLVSGTKQYDLSQAREIYLNVRG